MARTTFRKRLPFFVGTAAGALLLSGCIGLGVPTPPTPPPTTVPPKVTVYEAACAGTLLVSPPVTVASDSVTELSGIAASRHATGVWWANNDSGDTARLFAIGADGRDLGTYSFSGATAIDWEDIAIGPGPTSTVDYLYAADIGDNGHTRTSVEVYRVPEPVVVATAPTPPPATLTGVATFTFTYPDGAHDAEAFFVDPTTRQLFIVTKETTGISKVFRAPADLAPGTTTKLTRVATVNVGAAGMAGLVTAADVTPSGDTVALRTYTKVVLFPRAAGKPLQTAFARPGCVGKTGDEIQGESIGFTRDGRGYATSSEGAHPPLDRVDAP